MEQRCCIFDPIVVCGLCPHNVSVGDTFPRREVRTACYGGVVLCPTGVVAICPLQCCAATHNPANFQQSLTDVDLQVAEKLGGCQSDFLRDAARLRVLDMAPLEK